MFFFVCSAALFYLQRSSFLFAAFLFFICSVPFYIFAAVPFFVCSVSFLFAAFLFCLQRFSFVCSVSFLFAAFLFCLQRFFFVCSVSFLFAACPLWATVSNRLFSCRRSTRRFSLVRNSFTLFISESLTWKWRIVVSCRFHVRSIHIPMQPTSDNDLVDR